jgi:D-ribose pyranose/furanose isomerase RbsD
VSLDPRLLIGIALVVASVAGVVAIVSAFDTRVTVYAAAQTLAPGEPVRAGELLVRQVALDDAEGLYLTDEDLSQHALFATTVVRRGELIPRSAVATQAGVESTSIVLAVGGGLSESVVDGALVDIWASQSIAAQGDVGSLGLFGPPSVLNAGAVVVRVVESDGIVSAGDGRSVEVLVPQSRVARLLQAIANGDALAVVPAGIPLAAP